MTISELKSDVYFLCGTTSASYANTDLTRNINTAYQDVARLIWESDGAWQYDDSNASGIPYAQTSLVHNQQDYTLPSTTQRLERVEVKDSNGNWTLLKQIDIHDKDIALPEFMEVAGTPTHYDLFGRTLMLYPKPSSADITTTSGLAIYVSRDVTQFSTSATTASPGFATQFHRILSYAAALDFVEDPQRRKFLAEQKYRLENGLSKFYSHRDEPRPSRIVPNTKKRWRNYL